MNKKKKIWTSIAIGSVALTGATIAILQSNNNDPNFTGKSPEQVKKYFYSKEFQNLPEKKQIAIKKKVYGKDNKEGHEQFITQAKTYAKLPQQQKTAYLDQLIYQYVQKDQQKKHSAQSQKQTATQLKKQASAQPKNQTTSKAGKTKSADKKFTADDYRGWSEKLPPQERAYIMELKEAMQQRMDQRGIKLSK